MNRAVQANIEEGPEKELDTHETSLLSEAALAEDWDRPEEQSAWSHLQPVLHEVK